MALFVVAVAVSSVVSATTFYVAVDGSDRNPGYPDAPFRTLQQAVNFAAAGDVILVRDGRYTHESAVTGGDGSDNGYSPVVLYNSGTQDAPIIIKSENQWGAVLDCELLCDAYVDLYNASYIEIQGFVITGGYKEGIHSNDSAHHITLRGNRFEYIANRWTSTPRGLSGLYTNQNCHDFLIEGNIFHDIGRADANWLDHALYLHGWNFTIVNNVFYNILHGWSIQAADGLSEVVIANNTFAFPQGGGQSGQIMLWNTQNDISIRNNIFYGPRDYAITRYSSNVSNCVIDHNLVYGARALMADEQGCLVSGTITGVDPNFINTSMAPPDFHLRADSPAIESGTAGSGIGAFPYLPPPSVIITNTTTGAQTWSVGEGWTVQIAGTRAGAQVIVSVGSWAGIMGYADESGSFRMSGTAQPENVGTAYEVWSVGGATADPIPVTVYP